MRGSSEDKAAAGSRPWGRIAIQFGFATGLLALVSCSPPEANTSGQSPAPPPAASPPAQPALSQEKLAAEFAASGSVLFEAKTSADLLKFSPLQQVVLADDPGGLAITASNNDPSLFVPELQPKPCVIRIELTSPADGVVQIFFLVGPETSYTEQHSVVQTVRAGDNTVYLKIEATGLKGRWRFDPGSAPGKYLLKSFEVRAAEARAVP